MTSRKDAKRKLRARDELLEGFRARLGNRWVDDQLVLAAQEPVLSMEMLCSMISDAKVPLAENELKQIESLAEWLGVEAHHYSKLRSTK